MKALSFLLASLLALALTACAGNQPVSTIDASELSPAERHVALVNREADRHGIKVIWVNPPTERNTAITYSWTTTADRSRDDG